MRKIFTQKTTDIRKDESFKLENINTKVWTETCVVHAFAMRTFNVFLICARSTLQSNDISPNIKICCTAILSSMPISIWMRWWTFTCFNCGSCWFCYCSLWSLGKKIKLIGLLHSNLKKIWKLYIRKHKHKSLNKDLRCLCICRVDI